jgi:hypothetical protein
VHRLDVTRVEREIHGQDRAVEVQGEEFVLQGDG